MTEQSAEEAASAYGRAVVEGNMAAVVAAMTPDAMAKLMEISGRDFFSYTGCEVAEGALDGADRLIDITYETNRAERLAIRYRIRKIEGAWKIVDLERTAPPSGA